MKPLNLITLKSLFSHKFESFLQVWPEKERIVAVPLLFLINLNFFIELTCTVSSIKIKELYCFLKDFIVK
ncbi:hypothetical protein BCM0060_p2091 (plasmid) [Bacillus cereus]|nr:hypothetical protein BCM0060_p2091 [Bacillus cereus]BCC16645.1 hypothetical protein BCM0075_1415 [Bacillus cereus]BCC50475.1 hypothetical protein BCJMU02_p2069 [Bacillus cereus]